MRHVVIPQLDAAAYARHSLHGEHNAWVEKNCYIDLWIELLHALKLEPLAMMPFVLGVDFEGDQWTFFKPPHAELQELYGVDVQELTVWRPLIEHAQEHLAAGKLISTEADAFWLPDTAGTDYRHQHTKTTIVLNDLDIDRQRLGYFHNAGYYALEGEDFIKTFRLDAAPDPTFMPLFAEFVRIDRIERRPAAELVQRSGALLERHLRLRPAANPFTRFRKRFEQDLGWLQEKGLHFYHLWAFGTIRQAGAAFELAASYLTWLQVNGHKGLDPAIAAFNRISAANKTLILKAARGVNSRRAFDGSAMFDEMARAWEDGFDALLSAPRP
jgi:hypothetical protein